ncbi:leucine-rich repeat domain-containing protein, partial [Candidatus Thorarchaeota archaeon]
YSLVLDKTRIETIDLSPLTGIDTLKGLDLSENRLREVDLRPLNQCNSMQEIKLSRNPLTRVVAPLCLDCPCLEVDSGVVIDRRP